MSMTMNKRKHLNRFLRCGTRPLFSPASPEYFTRPYVKIPAKTVQGGPGGPGWSNLTTEKTVMISRPGPSGPSGPSFFEILHMRAHARARVENTSYNFINLFYRKVLGPLGPVNKIKKLAWTISVHFRSTFRIIKQYQLVSPIPAWTTRIRKQFQHAAMFKIAICRFMEEIMPIIDFKKYQSQTGKEETQTQETTGSPTNRTNAYPSPWTHRPAVMRLAEYMKMNRDKGFSIYRERDGFRLHFEPAMTRDDIGTARWTAAQNLCDLLEEARDDLNELISRGDLLPFIRTGDPRAGPS